MKKIIGEVIKNSSANTVMVSYPHTFTHSKYKKRITLKKKLMVHDELGAKVGQKVVVVPCVPVSKRKRHIVKEMV